jgi:hypothetical protein
MQPRAALAGQALRDKRGKERKRISNKEQGISNGEVSQMHWSLCFWVGFGNIS